MEDVNSRRAVCFFDSGIGGLTVMRECAELVTDADFIYFADNYNVPYGNLTEDELFARADGIFKKMPEFNPVAAVIACNTVTAVCAEKLREKYPFPIIGIQPAVKPAAAECDRCVVLATPVTAESLSLKNLVSEHGNGVTAVRACPDLAGYIERNVFNLEKAEIISRLPEINADGVIIGCTHYSYVSAVISQHYGCKIYDGKEGVARRLLKIAGKTDHRITPQRKIFFIGGDAAKNASVYSFTGKNR